MKTMDEITKEIEPILVEVLAVEPEEVVPSAKFFEDLGGESIDLLELTFHCEKHFEVKLRLQELASPDELVTDETGRLTEESLSAVKTRFPFLDYSDFEADPMKNRITELLTVDAIARFVRDALQASTAQDGAQDFQPSPGVNPA